MIYSDTLQKSDGYRKITSSIWITTNEREKEFKSQLLNPSKAELNTTCQTCRVVSYHVPYNSIGKVSSRFIFGLSVRNIDCYKCFDFIHTKWFELKITSPRNFMLKI